MVSSPHKKRAVQHVAGRGLCSTRRACRLVDLAPSSYYYSPQGPTDRRQRLEQKIIKLSKKHPRWGYRFIYQLLCRAGWAVNLKRVQPVRRQEGLGVRPVSKRQTAPPRVDGLSGASNVSRARLVVEFHSESVYGWSAREDADDGR